MARAILKRRNICTCKGHGYAGNYTTGTSGVATCVTPAESYKICQFCKTTFDLQEGAINPNNHANRTTTGQIDPTCTKEGSYSGWFCSACNSSGGGEVIPALGHLDDIIGQGQSPSCTENGHTPQISCSRCGEVTHPSEVIPFLDHNEVVDAKVEATCS